MILLGVMAYIGYAYNKVLKEKMQFRSSHFFELVILKAITMIAFLATVPVCFGQSANHKEFVTKYLDVRDGLSNNYVSRVINDELGIKWIATEGGLNKYDGLSFSVYTPRNTSSGLLNENIETLYKDSYNKIWIGTKSGGLSRYDPAHNTFKNFNHLLIDDPDKSIRITSIVEDGEGNIWAGSYNNDGLYLIDPANEKLIHHYFPDHKISSMIKDQFGNIWIAETKNVHKYDPSEQRMVTITSDNRMFALTEDKKRNGIWMSSEKALYYLDLNDYSINRHHYQIQGGEIQSNIHCMALDDHDRLWLGTWGDGVYISGSDAKDFQKIPLSRPYLGEKNVNYASILDIEIDDHGLVWLSTAYGGIIKLSPTGDFQYIGNESNEQIGLNDNNIQQLYFDEHDRLWVGTYGGGVNVNDDQNRFMPLPYPPFDEVYAFEETDQWWLVGGKQGLFAYKKNNLEVAPILFYPGLKRITALHLDKNRTLWVGTKQDGITIASLTTDESKIISEKQTEVLMSDRISAFLEDANGNIWIGTYNGLHLYNASENRFYTPEELLEDELPSQIVHDIYMEGNTLWIGMPGGLVEVAVNGNSLTVVNVFDTKSGLANDFITAVTGDGMGNIWVSSVYGISKLNRKKDLFVNFGPSDGIRSSAFNIGAVAKDSQGNILFGGTNGITQFNPGKVDNESRVPTIIFTGFYVDNQLVDVNSTVNDRVLLEKTIAKTEEITLSHQEQIFSFSLSATDYLGNDNVYYEYRLLGLRDQWIQNNNHNSIGFTGLKSGNYTLEVRASRDNQHWSDIKSVQLKILPPIWASSYALIAYLIGAIGIVLLIRTVAVNQTQLKSKLQIAQIEQEKEHELTEAKLKFFTNISHEFRTPLTLIISPLTEILDKTNLNKSLKKQLSGIQANADRLLNLINQLLDFRKAEKGMLRLQVAKGDFSSFVKEVYLSFKGLAASKKIQYKFEDNTSNLDLTFDRDKMEVVICNLLSNAFKYCKVKGEVNVSLTETGRHGIISVKDNGPGIPKEYQKKVFDRFFQIGETNSMKMVGSGIGLSLTKNIVDLHHGEIEVVSDSKRGTEFMIRLPKRDDHFQDEERIVDFRNSDHLEQYSDSSLEVYSLQLESGNSSNRDKILVVDDNENIRNYLKELLSGTYSVLEAVDGSEALAVAQKEIPDLVVSDVMMPVMDGITFCEHLKSGMSTSHIPVILLTARTSTVFEVDGLETGADDYVKKPFNASVLKARIATLLENRQKLKEYYLQKIQFETESDVKPTDFEGQFLQKAAKIVERLIGEEDFNRDVLAEELCMSQSTLLRKIKSLTGLTSSGFIKAIRLKKAAKIICTEETKLVQVAFEVGFKDYKHFQRSFKEQFGCSPSEYKERKRLESSLKRESVL